MLVAETLNLTQYLSRRSVACNISIHNKKNAIEQLSKLLAADNEAWQLPIYEALFKREKLGSTVLEHHIAMPHAILEEVSHPIIAIMTLDQPFAFDAPHQSDVDMIVGLVTPNTNTHMALLKSLAQLLDNKALRKELRTAASSDDLYRLFMLHCTTASSN